MSKGKIMTDGRLNKKEYGRTVSLFSNLGEPEALRAHVAAPHMKTYSEKTKDLVAKRTIHILSAID